MTEQTATFTVHGYQEEGTITTPFDMRVQNEIDRFSLVKSATSVTFHSLETQELLPHPADERQA